MQERGLNASKATNEPPEREAFPSFARAPLGGTAPQPPVGPAPFIRVEHEGGFYAQPEQQ